MGNLRCQNIKHQAIFNKVSLTKHRKKAYEKERYSQSRQGYDYNVENDNPDHSFGSHSGSNRPVIHTRHREDNYSAPSHNGDVTEENGQSIDYYYHHGPDWKEENQSESLEKHKNAAFAAGSNHQSVTSRHSQGQSGHQGKVVQQIRSGQRGQPKQPEHRGNGNSNINSAGVYWKCVSYTSALDYFLCIDISGFRQDQESIGTIIGEGPC